MDFLRTAIIFLNIASAYVITAVSCSKDQVNAVDLSSSGQILFSTTETRATASFSFREGDSFGVWGSFYDNAPAAAEPFYNNTRVNYVSSFWKPERVEFWIPSTNYLFHAIYPYTDFKQTNRLYHVSESFGSTEDFQILDFKAGSSPEPTDLMVSDLVRVSTTEDISVQQPVLLNFRHLLTHIRLNVKKNANIAKHKVILSSVKLSGMKTIGTYDSTDGSWTVSGQPDNSGINVSTFPDEGIIGDSGINVWWEKGAYVIPQPLVPEIRLTFNYLVYKKMSSGEESVKSESKSVVVPDVSPWVSGQRITYNVTVNSSTGIEFETPTVEPWEVSQNNNTIVIK